MARPLATVDLAARNLTNGGRIGNTHGTVATIGPVPSPVRRLCYVSAGPQVHFERKKKIDRNQARINDQIRISPIRVVGQDGAQLGIIPTEEALGIARESGLDLVEVAPREKPPVCRIMDYGKYKYQQKRKHNKGHVHQTKTKEIRLRPKTGQHDIDFKVNKAIGFLKQKDKVQVSVVFRGREIVHVEEGKRVMTSVIEGLEEYGKVELPPQQQGRRIVCTLAPK